MRADAHVASGARQVLVFAVRYVLVRDRIQILFRQSKVHNVNDMLATSRPPADQEVLRLDVAVKKTAGMHVLQTSYLVNHDSREEISNTS